MTAGDGGHQASGPPGLGSQAPAPIQSPPALSSAAPALGSPAPALIWAQARGGVIGRGGVLPWHVPEDGAHFRQLTAGGVVLMGRRTWDSLPERYRPLPGRRNLVLTRDRRWSAEGAEPVATLVEGLRLAGKERVWVIGGGELYGASIGLADRLEVTELDLEVEGDTLAPGIGAEWTAAEAPWQVSRTGIRYRFLSYHRTVAGDAAGAAPVSQQIYP